MDRATVTYLVDDTVQTEVIEGGHVSVQMGRGRHRRGATIVQVSDRLGGIVTRAHLFRRAEYVDVERGVDGD